MIEVADILRRHGPDYQRQHQLLPSQQKALADLVRCRTAAYGGHLYQCDRCGYAHYSYHSCGNRHCPKCHTHQTERWLEDHRHDLLSCPYYLLTFTLPAELRALVQAHQRQLYGLLLSTAAAAVQKLALDPQYVGAQPAILAVLHTWTRALLYHPHAHLLVSAGGLSADGQRWQPARNPAFLVPGFVLSQIFRGKFKAGLKSLGLFDQVPPSVWDKKWVVHCQPAGSGQKVLEYLGRYVFGTAIANSRLDAFDNGQVRFHYTDNRTHQIRQVDLRAEEFIRRFLLHTLPKGFVKVRTYGLWSAQGQARLEIARALLAPPTAPIPPVLSCLPCPEELAAPLPPPAEPPPSNRARFVPSAAWVTSYGYAASALTPPELPNHAHRGCFTFACRPPARCRIARAVLPLCILSLAEPSNPLTRTIPQTLSPRFSFPVAAATTAHTPANSPPNSKELRTSRRGLSSTQFFVAARAPSVHSNVSSRDKKLNSFNEI